MTDPNLPSIPGLDDNTGLDMRLPPLDVGIQDVRIGSIRFHHSMMGNPDGVMVEVFTGSDSLRAWRINLGGRFPKYGATDCKRLASAVRGLALDDPRAAGLTAAAVASMYGADQPYKDAMIRVEAFATEKVNAKTGRPYVNVRVIGPSAGAAPVAPAAAAPPPTPAAPVTPPPVPIGPPAGWFEFPAGDPRRGVSLYNAAGEIRPV